MQNIREILRLIHEGNLSNRQIAKSCHCSPTTIGAIIDRYKEKNLTWPEILQMDDTELESKLYCNFERKFEQIHMIFRAFLMFVLPFFERKFEQNLFFITSIIKVIR